MHNNARFTVYGEIFASLNFCESAICRDFAENIFAIMIFRAINHTPLATNHVFCHGEDFHDGFLYTGLSHL